MILLWLGTFLWGLSNMILRPKRLSSGMVYKMAVRDGKLNEERYKKIKKKHSTYTRDQITFETKQYLHAYKTENIQA